jgi:predicted metal-binding membrane protein
MTPPTPLARERAIILGALLALAALAWALVIWQAHALSATSMSGNMGGGIGGWTMGMSAALFLAIWIAMMVAMMFPSAAPMILMFHASARGKRQRGQVYAPTWIFVAGYLLAVGLDTLAARSMDLMANAARRWPAAASRWPLPAQPTQERLSRRLPHIPHLDSGIFENIRIGDNCPRYDDL